MFNGQPSRQGSETASKASPEIITLDDSSDDEVEIVGERETGLSIFTAEYRPSAMKADRTLIENAGGVDMVLREMWKVLPPDKKYAYELKAQQKMPRGVSQPPPPPLARQPNAKELQRDTEKQRKHEEKERARQEYLAKRDAEKRQRFFMDNLMSNRKNPVEDLQLLAEFVVGDSESRKKLHQGYNHAEQAGFLEMPFSVEVTTSSDLPASLYAELMWMTSMFQRFQTMTELPDLSFNEVLSIVRNRRAEEDAKEEYENDEDDGEEDGGDSGDEVDSDGKEDEHVVAIRNAVHLSLIRLLGSSCLERSAFCDLDMSQPRMLDDQTWPEVLKRFVCLESESLIGFPKQAIDGARLATVELAANGYCKLTVSQRVEILGFLCHEAIDTSECRESIDAGNERIAELKRERAVQQAEEKRLTAERRQRDLEEYRKKMVIEAEKQAYEREAKFVAWCDRRGVTVPAWEPGGTRQQYIVVDNVRTNVGGVYDDFMMEYNRGAAERKKAEDEAAKKRATEGSDSSSESEEDSEAEPTVVRASSNESVEDDEKYVGLSRGEKLRRMRAEREEKLVTERRRKREEQEAASLKRAAKQKEKDDTKKEQEKKQREEEKLREREETYERELAAAAPRNEPLGYDRYWNRYWHFGALWPDRVFVEDSAFPSTAWPPEVQAFEDCEDQRASFDDRRAAATAAITEVLPRLPLGRLQKLVQAMPSGQPPGDATAVALVAVLLQHDLAGRDSYFARLAGEHRAAIQRAGLAAGDGDSDEEAAAAAAAAENSDDEDAGTPAVAAPASLSPRKTRRERMAAVAETDDQKEGDEDDADDDEEKEGTKWSYLGSTEQVGTVLTYLNKTGERETVLKRKLEASRPLFAKACGAASAGGRSRKRVRRRFGGNRKKEDASAICNSVLAELLSTFLSAANQNKARLDAVKRSVSVLFWPARRWLISRDALHCTGTLSGQPAGRNSSRSRRRWRTCSAGSRPVSPRRTVMRAGLRATPTTAAVPPGHLALARARGGSPEVISWSGARRLAKLADVAGELARGAARGHQLLRSGLPALWPAAARHDKPGGSLGLQGEACGCGWPPAGAQSHDHVRPRQPRRFPLVTRPPEARRHGVSFNKEYRVANVPPRLASISVAAKNAPALDN
jgi:hypothetical protein